MKEYQLISNLGIGAWNQTMFAGNVYHLIIQGQDGNGWKDIEFIEIDLGINRMDIQIQKSCIILEIILHGQIVHSTSIVTDEDGNSMTTIRSLDGNLLFDPFTTEFMIDIPITMGWGLPKMNIRQNTG